MTSPLPGPVSPPSILVRFHRCVQDSQEFGSDDEHMVSCVFFEILVDGTSKGDFTVDVKQTVGSDIETCPIEVTALANYDGAFDYNAFRRCAEEYYRREIGSRGSGIRIVGAKNMRLKDNVVYAKYDCGFVAHLPSGPAWRAHYPCGSHHGNFLHHGRSQ